MAHRTILHIDMDAFYASVELLDNPTLQGKPVIVGGGVRGVVSAASYEARKYGVHSAMPIFRARKLCPQGVFLPVRMSRYKETSQKVMAVLESFSPLVEQVSIDEAYLDVTGTRRLRGDPVDAALSMKSRIRKEIGITCSVGIAPNKFLAKIASEMNKPDGLFVIEPQQVAAFLSTLPVSKIPGVGKKSVEKLHLLGVETVGDVASLPEKLVIQRFGVYGERLLELTRGVDEREVTPDHETKSVSAERTFAEDTSDRETLRHWLLSEAEEVGQRLRRYGLKGKTIVLKCKTQDFRLSTRSRTLDRPTDATSEIYETACRLLDEFSLKKPLRLIGVGVATLDRPEGQLSLWTPDRGVDGRHSRADRAVDAVKAIYGGKSIRRGSLLDFDK